MESKVKLTPFQRRKRAIIRDGFQYLHIVGVFFLIMNLIYRLYHAIVDFQLFPKTSCDETTHLEKQRRVEGQVKRWKSSGSKKTMCTARPKYHSIMMTAPNYRDTLHAIDLNDLNQIVRLDEQRKVVRVEPLVCMGQLMDYLLPRGWSIPIVPEIEALTVGGLIMGGGLQSSSHKYGLFHRTCSAYEIVISNGHTLRCTKNENTDLFYGIPASYGTLGLLTAVEIDLIPATKYVKVEYYPSHNYEEGLALMEKFAADKTNYFVEPILFSKDKWVIMPGQMVNSAEPGKVNSVSRWYKPWFFKHVESFLTTGYGYDYIPLRNYYFRHTRCLFWHSAPFVPYGNHPLFRYLLGWTLPINIRMLKTIQPDATNLKMFVQDFMVHSQAIKDIVKESERLSKFFPIWICPVNMAKDKTYITAHLEPLMKARGSYMMYDVGFYGIPSYKKFYAPTTTRKLEEITMHHKGVRALYTDTYMTREELTDMFSLTQYEMLRKKYDAEDAFPHVYDKVSIKGRKEGL